MNTEKIQELSNQITDLKEQLHIELLKQLEADNDVTEMLEMLNTSPSLTYTRFGLMETVDIEFEDYAEESEAAFEDFMKQRDITVDFRLGRLQRAIPNYILAQQTVDDKANVTLSVDGEEETVAVELDMTSPEELITYMQDMAASQDSSVRIFIADQYGNVEEILE